MKYIHKVYKTGQVWTDPPCTPEAEQRMLALLEEVFKVKESLATKKNK